MEQIFPFLQSLKNYSKSTFSGDLISGLIIGVMLVPQGMAYAMLAGMSPVYGLYAAFIPQIIYSLFGTSRQVAIGPVATDSIIIASGIGAIAVAGSETYFQTAILLSLMVGTMLILMRLLRLGYLVNFLSRPVISGFTSGAAVIIILSQIKYILGIEVSNSNNQILTLIDIAKQLNQTNFISLTIGIVSMLTILLLKRLVPKIPSLLVLVVIGILAVYKFELNVNVVGAIPKGLPSFQLVTFELKNLMKLFFFAGTFSLIIYMEAMAIGKSFEVQQDEYKINANRELLALGLANIVGGFFQSFPVSAGFSRTAVNVQSGAKTRISSFISALFIGCTLIFLTPYFYHLPHAVLSAIIIVAVTKLFDISIIKKLQKSNKIDFYMLIITALATIILGILGGLILGVGLSLILVIYNVSYPHIAIEGKIKGTNQYRNVKRFKNLEEFDDVVIVRIDAQLFFANINYFEEKLDEIVSQKSETIKHVIINAIAINGIDTSASLMLEKLIERYKEKDITILFASIKGPVRDQMKRCGLFDLIGSNNFFLNVDDAVKFAHGEDFNRNENIVLQTNNND